MHNTQPWRFVLSGYSLEIHADWSRRLPILDPRGRQLLISCGSAVFNARAAIDAAGYRAAVDRFPSPSQPTLLVRLTPHDRHIDRAPAGIAHLDPSVELRRSNRHAFFDDTVPGGVVDALMSAAEAEGAELLCIHGADRQAIIGGLSGQAHQIEDVDPAYRAELHASTSTDPARRDGISTVDLAQVATGSTYRLPLNDDANDMCLLLLGTRQDTPASWLRAGEALERVLLEVTRRGYAVSLLNQLLEVAETNALVRSQLQLAMHPHVLLRVGRAPATPMSRRRRLVDMIDAYR